MKVLSRFYEPGAVVVAFLIVCLSGCVVHDREGVHDGGYAQGYQEGYYDREHHRYWHEQAWHDCVVDDVHCH